MGRSNYHTHSSYCDGSSSPEDYIREAVKEGLSALGFSSHAPNPFPVKWAMDYRHLESYMSELRVLKRKWKNQIEVFTGLEADYIPKIIGPKTTFIKELNLDYVIGAVHFIYSPHYKMLIPIDGGREDFLKGISIVFSGHIKRMVTKYYELVREMLIYSTPDIVAHPDKIKYHNYTGQILFDENEDWYQKLVHKTLKTIKRTKVIVELNTRGKYKYGGSFYPSWKWLEEMYLMKIPVTLGSDAHKPQETDAGYSEALQILKDIGFRELYCLKNYQWAAVDIRDFEYRESISVFLEEAGR